MGDNLSAPRRIPTQGNYVAETVGTIQQTVLMMLTGQAHILQHVEQTGEIEPEGTAQ